VEPIVLLGLRLVHEALVDVSALVDDSICLVLNGSLLFLGQGLIMSDIQVSNLGCFLGSVLPHMWA
jgi:hypothetical protein